MSETSSKKWLFNTDVLQAFNGGMDLISNNRTNAAKLIKLALISSAMENCNASKDGKLAVVAVMFEDGKENPIIKKIWNKMPHKAGESAGCGLTAKAINSILPKDKDYYRFSGSLTTPPCSEGVRWFVLKDYATVSDSQVKELAHLLHHPNNRPIQPINARKVIK